MLPKLSTARSSLGILAPPCHTCIADDIVACTPSGSSLLYAHHDFLDKPLKAIENVCTALGLSRDGRVLLLGTIPGDLFRTTLEATDLIPVQLPVDEAEEHDAVSSIVCDDVEGRFGVARGRHVFVVTSQGELLSAYGPLPDQILSVGWAACGESAPCIVALTASACHVWPPSDGSYSKTSIALPCPKGNGLTMLAASPRAAYIATACEQGQVHCWNAATVLQEGIGDAVAPPALSFGAYQGPVKCMAWDNTGRFLATADGADCTVWDMSGAGAIHEAESIMLCGHDPATNITCLAFQPNATLLATASDAGNIALFDGSSFRCGGVAGPCATASLPDPGGAVVSLDWLPNGRLFVGSDAGTAIELSPVTDVVDPPGTNVPTTQLTSNAQHMAEETILTSAEDQCEPTGPGEEGDELVVAQHMAEETILTSAEDQCEPTGPGEAGDELVVHGTTPFKLPSEGQPKLKPIRSGRELVSFSSSSSSMGGDPGADSVIIAAAAATTTEEEIHEHKRLPVHSSSHKQQQQQTHVQQLQQRSPSGRMQPSPSAPQQSRRGSGSMQSPRRRGSGGRGATAAYSGATNANSPAGMSQSLLQHIQQLREAPPHARSAVESQDQLTGWGLGYPGGLSATLPWAHPAVAVPSPATAAVAGGGGGMPTGMRPIMQANYLAPQYYQHPYQAMGMGMGLAPGMLPPSPSALAGIGAQPMHPMPMSVMASPVGGYGLSPASPPPPPPPLPAPQVPHMVAMSPTAAMQQQRQSQDVANLMMSQQQQHQQHYLQHASGMQAQQQWNLPYMQMHQWAGTAPGYLNYQRGGPHHASPPYGASQPVPVNASVSSPRSTASKQRPTTAGASGGASQPVSPMERHRQHNNEPASRHGGATMHYMNDTEATESNNRGSYHGGNGNHLQARRGNCPVAAPPSPSLHAAVDEDISARAQAGSTAATATPVQRGDTLAPQPSGGLNVETEVAPAPQRAPAQREEEEEEEGKQRREDEGEDRGSVLLEEEEKEASTLVAASSIATEPPTPRSPADGGRKAFEISGVVRTPIAGEPRGAADAGGLSLEVASTVYVGNLAPSVDEFALAWTCNHFGPVTHVQVIRDKATQASRGFGFVTFEHPAYATLAMQQLNGQVFYGPFGGQRLKAAPTNKRM